MKLSSPFVLVAAVFLGTIVKISSSQNLSASYAPVYVECPADIQWLRPATGLSKAESDWVYGRKKVVLQALSCYLERLGMRDFDSSEFIHRMHLCNYSSVPILGLAISGGGVNSGYTGTSAMRGMDSRLDEANEQRTGGLLQSLTYLSGLSGGSYPVVSFTTNNFPTADDILEIWQPQFNRLLPINGTPPANSTVQYLTIPQAFKDLYAKAEAGFQVGIPDYLGINSGYEFLSGPNGGIGVTFSGVVNQSKFISHDMPFPIIQYVDIDKYDPTFFGLQTASSNATIYDVTPFELGAWGSAVHAFTPTEWLGTRLKNGSPVNTSACVRGFDRASYIIGSTSGAYNNWYIEDLSNDTEAQFSKRSPRMHHAKRDTKALSKRYTFPTAELFGIWELFNATFKLPLPEIAYSYYPNPFFNSSYSAAGSDIPSETDLRFDDGSESGQAIPLWGQIQPARNLDFIIAWDANADAAPYNWNNGTNLYDTYLSAQKNQIPFPIVPPAITFVANNWTHKPVFFGCDAKLTTMNSIDSPIVAYFANAPYSAYTNYSYSQMPTTLSQMNDIYVNGFNEMTQGNGTLDKDWPVCLGCAAIDRSLAKVGMKRTCECEQCFERYCWNGTTYEGEVSVVDIPLVLDPTLGFLEWNKTHNF